jgi:hypothetical protein
MQLFEFQLRRWQNEFETVFLFLRTASVFLQRSATKDPTRSIWWSTTDSRSCPSESVVTSVNYADASNSTLKFFMSPRSHFLPDWENFPPIGRLFKGSFFNIITLVPQNCVLLLVYVRVMLGFSSFMYVVLRKLRQLWFLPIFRDKNADSQFEFSCLFCEMTFGDFTRMMTHQVTVKKATRHVFNNMVCPQGWSVCP